MTSLLATIQKTKHETPPRILIHGSEKSGKSTFSASAPKPIFIRTEDGLNGIDADAFPLALDSETVRQQLMTLVNEEHDFKTVVLDSADWLERLVHEAVCKKEGVDNIIRAGGGYGNGYTLAMNIWKAIFALLDKLNREKGMIVIVICHSRIVTVNDPLHEPYDVASLKLHTPKNGNGAADMLKEWADIIGYARIPLLIADGKPLSDTSTGGNILILGNSPGCLAGNRYGLPHELPLSWRAFQAAFKKATTTETTTTKEA
jgi:hypothetical protein